MSSVTVNGHTYTDDNDASTGLGNGGHRARLVPMLADTVVVVGQAVASAAAAATSESNAAASAASAAAIAGAFVGTSTTSWTPAIGTQAFTTQAGEQYVGNVFLMLVSAATPTAWGFGQVQSYSGTTLTMDIQVINGSGAHTDWNISLVGARGAPGPSAVPQWVKKSAAYTAVAGDAILADRSSAPFTILMPATPAANDVVRIKDYKRSATNALTIDWNGNKHEELSDATMICSAPGFDLLITYIDTTVGWKL